jgi:hypothetical protein
MGHIAFQRYTRRMDAQEGQGGRRGREGGLGRYAAGRQIPRGGRRPEITREALKATRQKAEARDRRVRAEKADTKRATASKMRWRRIFAEAKKVHAEGGMVLDW